MIRFCLRRLFPALVLGLLLAAPAMADTSSAPYGGTEAGPRHSYGPDSEGRRDNKRMAMPLDAYGNPIMGAEETDPAAPPQRPSAGAYGGYDKNRQQERPLPDVPGKPKWQF